MDVSAERQGIGEEAQMNGKIWKLEVKKTLRTRTTWILLVLALFLTVLLAYLPTAFCYSRYTDDAGNEVVLTGKASIAYEKERQAGAAGAVTPQRVRAAVEEYQACLNRYGVTESYDLPEGVYEREILPVAPLLHGVKEAFADPDTGMAPSLMEIEPEWLDEYDAVREERIVALMKMEQPDCPAVWDEALKMYQQVEKPYEVYPGLDSSVMDYQNIMGFLVLLFCVVIAAPVFSADYQSGADDILRCTRYGRGQLGAARAAAALCVSGGAFGICSVVYILLANTWFGWECTHTSVQMVYSIVTLARMNMGQLQWFFALSGLLSVLASVSFTLFLSSRLKSTAASLAAAMVFCILPVVIYMTIPGSIATWLCCLLPASGVSIQASILYALTDFKFLSVAGMPVWTPYMMIGANLIEILVFFFLAVRSYDRHTVC